MKWDKIKNKKKTLINQIRTSIREIRTELARPSVNSWTNGICRMLERRCEYICFLNKLHDMKALQILDQIKLKRNPNYTEECSKSRKRFWPILYRSLVTKLS